MISLSLIKNEEYTEVKSILNLENIEDCLSQGIVYVLRNRDDILGLGKILVKYNYGILKYIVIKEEHRGSNLGDAILRALFYKCESLGIDKVYSNNLEGYLRKKGFEHNNDELKDSYKLFVDIKKFFDKSCSSDCGDMNGI